MGYVVFRGERKLADVVKSAYGELKVADRRRAEAALVRANPHLLTLADVEEGALVVVPRVPGIRAPAEKRPGTPGAEAGDALGDALRAHRTLLGESLEAEKRRQAELAKLLASRAVRAELGGISDDVSARVQAVADALKAGRADLADREKAIERLADAETALAELAERMG